MQYPAARSIFFTFLFSLVATLIVACGGGSGGGASSSGVSASSGNVAILLTDGPAEDFDEINITVVKAELLSDSGRITLYEGNETFNLLDLSDDARLFAIRNDVPAGVYSKIRLTLTKMVLVKKDANGNVIETAQPKLPGNGKLDLVPRGDFAVVADETLLVQIDMDANKSIHIVGTGSGKYKFRPVVFVDVVSDAFLSRFVRLHGVVEDIDNEDREFELCRTDVPVRIHDDKYDDKNDGCIDVVVDDETSIFGEDGRSAEFGDLVEGEEATVYGRFRREDDDSDDDERHELEDMEFVAAVIELGKEGAFQKLDGVAESSPDGDDQFVMTIDTGQGFVEGTRLNVQLQDGTKIVNRNGEPLSRNDIATGVPLSVDGVLDLTKDPDLLYASIVVIDTDIARQTRISGTVGDNPDGSCGLALMTDSGDRSVRTSASTQVFLVTATELNGESQAIRVEDIDSGQDVDVYGMEATDGCFNAETIIAFELNS